MTGPIIMAHPVGMTISSVKYANLEILMAFFVQGLRPKAGTTDITESANNNLD